MARPKRTSAALTKAEQRAAGMRAIDPELDLGNGLTLTSYSQKIEYLRSQITLYTTALAQTDDLTRKITALEAELNQTSEQMLLSIGGRYGKSSSEYGQAGGIPRGERRRKNARSAAPTTATTTPTAPTPAPTPEPTPTEPTSFSMNGNKIPVMNGNSH
jgi:hypothetical protein